jgi:hypothetical protein
MRMLDSRGIVHAPVSTAWRLLTDTHAWPDWGPSVRAVECATRFIGPDSHGRVQTAIGLWLPFQITGWEPDTFWSWTVAGIPATGHRVSATGPDTCDVIWTIPSWAPFYLPVCKTAMRRLARLAAGQSV